MSSSFTRVLPSQFLHSERMVIQSLCANIVTYLMRDVMSNSERMWCEHCYLLNAWRHVERFRDWNDVINQIKKAVEEELLKGVVELRNNGRFERYKVDFSEEIIVESVRVSDCWLKIHSRKTTFDFDYISERWNSYIWSVLLSHIEGRHVDVYNGCIIFSLLKDAILILSGRVVCGLTLYSVSYKHSVCSRSE